LRATLLANEDRPTNHWSECGQAISVPDSEPLGCPHRSVPALGNGSAVVKFASNIYFGLLVVFACSGCTSYQWLLRPGIAGTVIDANTRSPIAGAQVTFSRDPKLYANWYYNESRGLRLTNTFTASDGTFEISPLQKRGLIDTTAPNDGVFYALIVKLDGYQPYTNRFWYPSGQYPIGSYSFVPIVQPKTNFDKIQLERLQQ
jgi:hypothetical protein